MSERRWWLTASASLAVAASCFALATWGYAGQSAGPPSPRSSMTMALSRPGWGLVPAARRSRPVTLRIAAIHLAAPLTRLGVNPDGTVQTPTSFRRPGWFRLGPTPGQRGSAVILGHVDSERGPAVFFRLGALRPGDRVAVTLADRSVTHFRVTSVAMYRKARFPARRVYGSHGFSALQLVTCGGRFDHHTGHYLSNVVVYTRLVATTRA